jgi:hypothetical protein
MVDRSFVCLQTAHTIILSQTTSSEASRTFTDHQTVADAIESALPENTLLIAFVRIDTYKGSLIVTLVSMDNLRVGIKQDLIIAAETSRAVLGFQVYVACLSGN